MIVSYVLAKWSSSKFSLKVTLTVFLYIILIHGLYINSLAGGWKEKNEGYVDSLSIHVFMTTTV